MVPETNGLTRLRVTDLGRLTQQARSKDPAEVKLARDYCELLRGVGVLGCFMCPRKINIEPKKNHPFEKENHLNQTSTIFPAGNCPGSMPKKHSNLLICAMVKSRYIGDKLIPPLMTESL